MDMNRLKDGIREKVNTVKMLAVFYAGLLSIGMTACDDGLDVTQAYPFTVETMPVPKELAKGETAEIRCELVREGEFDGAVYTIRYFQFDGKGTLKLDNGLVFQPNDRYLLENEKFRPYLLYLAIPFALIGVLTFYTPPFGDMGKLVYAYITYSLMMMVYSAINVPYASLLGVMSPDPSERNTLSTYRMMFAYLGSFIALLLFMPMVNAFSGHSKEVADQQFGWFMAVVVIAIMCAVLFFGCFAWTKERVKPINDKKTSLKDDIKDLFHNKPWWILFGAGVATLVFNSIRDGAAVYYFKYFIIEDEYRTISLMGVSFVLSGLYLSIGQIANIVGVILAAPMSNKIGKKRTFALSMLVASALSVVFFWFDKDDLVLIFVFQCLISICAGSIFPLLWSMYADCADFSELKTGNRATGLIFSASSMSQKFGWAIGTAVTGWLLSFFGFQANAVQSEETINGIKMFLSLLPAIAAFISVVFVCFYPLGEQKMKGIMEQLNLKRQSKNV